MFFIDCVKIAEKLTQRSTSTTAAFMGMVDSLFIVLLESLSKGQLSYERCSCSSVSHLLAISAGSSQNHINSSQPRSLASVVAPTDSCFSLPWLLKGRQNAEDLSCGGTLKIEQ